MVNCPSCNSSEVVRKGSDRKGRQRYLCKDCGRSFGCDEPLMESRNRATTDPDDLTSNKSFSLTRRAIKQLEIMADMNNTSQSKLVNDLILNNSEYCD